MDETEVDGADTMGTTTVVCEGDWGALLQYPASLGVKHVKERYGQRVSSPSCAVSTKKAKVMSEPGYLEHMPCVCAYLWEKASSISATTQCIL